ncbi:hypothetical protein P3S67_031542 [Capsicum chacoense]
MLALKKFLVYLPTGSENDWTTAIHIAASEGDVDMIIELLNHCPDFWDILKRNNQNALHVAVLNNQHEVVRFLLDSDKCDSLVDEPDSDGNTPLHLLAASALSCKATTKKEKLMEDLCSIGRFGKRDFEVKRKKEYMPNPNAETGTVGKMQLREDDHDKAKKANQIVIESIMKSAQFHIVVETLLMTVTFAAGITLPGGFVSDSDSHNQGMAILTRKTAFRAFVVSDAIAFTCSAVAIFIYFLMADSSRFHQNMKAVEMFYDLTGIFQCLSMLAVVIAFAMDICFEVSRSIGDAYLKRAEFNREPLLPKFRFPGTFEKPILLAEPSIIVQKLVPEDQFLIFASDGLWEHLSNQEAVDIVSSFEHHKGIARKLVKAALQEAALEKRNEIRRSFHDDITVIYCIRSLWRWNKPLWEEPDLWCWNSLHYAVKLGLAGVVSDMLAWKKSLVYLPAGSEYDWTTAIHIAASEGDVNMIEKLLNHCPDCWDTLNSNSQNALHVAILNNQDKVVRFLLGSDKCDSLVDEPDSDDNSPLHLLAAHVRELINHPRAKKMTFNKENQTPLDIALSCKATTKKEKLVKDLFSIGQFGKRDFEVKRKYEYMPNPNDETGTRVKMQLRDDHDKAIKEDQTVIEIIMKSAQFHIVVATLIMTITFAAGVTLPGGFESDPDSPNKGMAILIRKTTFRAFVVSDAIAFTFSAVAIFIYVIMASVVPKPENEKIIQKLYDNAAICQCLSMLAVVIAFATGMIATLSHSLGFAITVCSISCLSILLYHLVVIYIARKSSERHEC